MDGIMSDDTPYKPNEINDEQRKPLEATRDIYAACEVIGAALVGKVADLSHTRDIAARMINYSFKDMTSAGLATGDEHLAEALMHLQMGVAKLKMAHNRDIRVLEKQTYGRVDVGRPTTVEVFRFADTLKERLTDKDGERMKGFGR